MRCHICDRVLDSPRFNADHESYEPCDSCLVVIADTLAGFTDKPSADEDELGWDPTYDGLYPAKEVPFPDEEIE